MNELYHPAANIFPLMDEVAYAALRDDIAANGLIEPIWFCDGKILDGRNRWRACNELGISPEVREYTGDDPIGFVVSLNLSRRHLTSSQRAVVALEVERQLAVEAKKRQREAGGDRKSEEYQKSVVEKIPQPIGDATGKSRDTAAAIVGTNPRYVSDAKRIQAAAPELLPQIAAGELSIPEAKRLTGYDRQSRSEILARVNDGAAKNITEAARQIRHEQVKNSPPITGKYRIIYADPPWSYGDERTGLDGYSAAADHYPTMTIDELCNLPVKDIAEQNAVLFLWVTSPLLEDSFRVINAWGFKYKASFVWDKVRHNVGHYNSVRHEFLLICTRGSCTPDKKQLFDSVQSIERTDKHSQKPEAFREIIDTLYTSGNRVELFARKPAPGWDVWGNEC